MPKVYDGIDLLMTFSGDFFRGQDGDIADTKADQIVYIIQEVMTIANSDIRDWEDTPNRAAALNDFVGEPNNRDTAQRITDRLKTALITNNIVAASDLNIKVTPISRHEVLIIVAIQATPTNNNSIVAGQPAVVTLVYNYAEQGVMLVGSK